MIESIYNYHKISPLLATGGQPDEHELHDIGKTGFEVVINLGLDKAEYSIPNEQAILTLYGISYYHLPVSFQKPQIEYFWQFSKILRSIPDKKVFVHCAANKRVSVFVSLYQVIEMKWPFEKAQDTILTIWQPNDVWEEFISNVLASEQ